MTWQAGRVALCLFLLMGLLALLCAAALPWPWSAPAMALVLAYLAWSIRARRRGPQQGVFMLGPTGLRVQWGKGEAEMAEVLPTTLVCAHLIVLHLRVGKQRRWRALVLWPDCMAADDFRQLSARLRWGAGQPNRINKRPGSSGSASTRADMS
ncbi:protein YgfX [Silvimonas iriomotensis]|uniref:Toxin CptA n=1 Tax=Silvimonas iriomotensis TaxID=449662 RepID=A0ABQ2P845_9NEIS|nr:protein YgfX [Silvimonas iriomotensis]GGP20425.1 hypothetical protein GCM10010970_15160 [Silvimonas iriomotensis]